MFYHQYCQLTIYDTKLTNIMVWLDLDWYALPSTSLINNEIKLANIV